MTNHIPNLDAMEPDELWAFWKQYQHATARQALALFGIRFRGYTRIAVDLAHYAANKATAMHLRKSGQIRTAETYELICERIFESLPDVAKW